MSKLERDIRYNVKTGASIPATVVDIFFNKASVMLLTNGAILRNLDVVGGSIAIGQQVRVDFTTSKPTVLTYGVSDTSVAVAASSQAGGGGGGATPIGPGEGPGIDIVGTTVGFGGDTCLIYNSDGNPVQEFVATSAGLQAGLNAMNAGDVLELPNIRIGTGQIFEVKLGILRGQSRFGSIIDGSVIVDDNCTIENLSIIRTVAAADVYGVVLKNNSTANSCYINVRGEQIVYGFYLVPPSQDKYISYSIDTIVIAECLSENGEGWGYWTENGETLYVTGGRVEATTAPFNYQYFDASDELLLIGV